MKSDNNNYSLPYGDLGNAYDTKVPVSAEGKWKIKYEVCDNAGNCATKSSGDIKIDTTNPTFSCSLNSKHQPVVSNIVETLSGVDKIYYKNTISDDFSGGWWSTMENNTGDAILDICGGAKKNSFVEVLDNAGNATTKKCGDYKPPACECSSEHPELCCSKTNLEKCPFVSTCRKGITEVYRSDNLLSYGTVCHSDTYLAPSTWGNSNPYYCGNINDNRVGAQYHSTKLYIISSSDTYVEVCFKAQQGGTWVFPGQTAGTTVCGKIYNYCISPEINSFCEFRTCPDR